MKRYTLSVTQLIDHNQIVKDESIYGDWCEWKDVEKLIEENEKLKKCNKELKYLLQLHETNF